MKEIEDRISIKLNGEYIEIWINNSLHIGNIKSDYLKYFKKELINKLNKFNF